MPQHLQLLGGNVRVLEHGVHGTSELLKVFVDIEERPANAEDAVDDPHEDVGRNEGRERLTERRCERLVDPVHHRQRAGRFADLKLQILDTGVGRPHRALQFSTCQVAGLLERLQRSVDTANLFTQRGHVGCAGCLEAVCNGLLRLDLALGRCCACLLHLLDGFKFVGHLALCGLLHLEHRALLQAQQRVLFGHLLAHRGLLLCGGLPCSLGCTQLTLLTSVERVGPEDFVFFGRELLVLCRLQQLLLGDFGLTELVDQSTLGFGQVVRGHAHGIEVLDAVALCGLPLLQLNRGLLER